MERPENYDAMQLSWSRGGSIHIERGAISRVQQCCDVARERKLSVERVCVIGPQHGFELEEFNRQGVKQLMAIDCVPEFVDECREKGFEIVRCDAEHLDEIMGPDDRWNFYTCHSLEHCWDIAAAVKNIVQITLDWSFVCVPIEHGVVRDRAHYSAVKDADQFVARFEPLHVAWSKELDQTRELQDFRSLFVRER